jgi:hypothetical protein
MLIAMFNVQQVAAEQSKQMPLPEPKKTHIIDTLTKEQLALINSYDLEAGERNFVYYGSTIDKEFENDV